jgi:hypothetical protein
MTGRAPRFLFAFPLVRDLLLRAKHLFVVATFTTSTPRPRSTAPVLRGWRAPLKWGNIARPEQEKPHDLGRGAGLRRCVAGACLSAGAPFCKPMETPAMPPIRLSDSELDAVMAAARPIAVERRDAFCRRSPPSCAAARSAPASSIVSWPRCSASSSTRRTSPTRSARASGADCSGDAWPVEIRDMKQRCCGR